MLQILKPALDYFEEDIVQVLKFLNEGAFYRLINQGLLFTILLLAFGR